MQLADHLKLLIERALNYGRLAGIEGDSYDSIRLQLKSFERQLLDILASYPTCVIEERNFLDVILRDGKYYDKLYYDLDGRSMECEGIIVNAETSIMAVDFEGINLKKLVDNN